MSKEEDNTKNDHNKINKKVRSVQQIVNLRGYNTIKNQIIIVHSNLNSIQFKQILTQQKYVNVSTIKKINLGLNQQLDDQAIKYLTHQSCKWLQLNSLELYNNYITIKGLQYLSKAAQIKYFPQLSYLNLNGNKIGYNIHKQSIKIEQGLLLKFCNQNTKLQYLSLWENQINDYTMKILFQNPQKIKRNFSYLKNLSFYSNKIKSQGIKKLTDQNILFPSLLCLSLADNKINKDGIKYLVSNKAKFNKLQKLWLYNNIFIGDEGIFYLIKEYQFGLFSSLKVLDIRNINLSDKGIQYFLKMYNLSKKLKIISTIDISENYLLINKKNVQNKFKQRFSSKVYFSMNSQELQ